MQSSVGELNWLKINITWKVLPQRYNIKMADGKMTWDDLQRIIESGTEDKAFIERARKSIVRRETGKSINEMTRKDLNLIIRNGCKDQELIARIESNLSKGQS